MMAVVVFGVAAYFGPPDNPGPHPATLAALTGLLVLVACLVTPPAKTMATWLPVIAVTCLLLAARAIDPVVLPDIAGWARIALVVWLPIVLALTSATALLALYHRRGTLAVAALAVGIVTISTIVLVAFEPPRLDVLLLHDRAAEVVAGGASPYGDLVVVPNTSPFAESGSSIVGYPYPPLTALAYVLGVWVTGDSRWVSLMAVLTASALLISIQGRQGSTRAAGGVILAALPGWPLVLLMGFTEPLTLMLFTLCLLLWYERPLAAAVLGGLAIASKQYMLMVAPLLLIAAYRRNQHRADSRESGRKLVGVMVVTGIATLLPSVILDWNNLLRATVTNLADLAIRPDGSSLQGLLLNLGSELKIPLIATLGVPILVAGLVGTRIRTRRDLAIGASVVLTLFFLLGTQAFANYWFLVAGLVILAFVLPDSDWEKGPVGQVPLRVAKPTH